jgi:hypothetical protein
MLPIHNFRSYKLLVPEFRVKDKASKGGINVDKTFKSHAREAYVCRPTDSRSKKPP